MSELEELRAAVAELRDIEAIKTLKARYCHLVDGRRWAELAELWTEDAVCDYGFFGAYNGRDEIVHTFFEGLVDAAASFMCHMVHNPLIELQGDNAKGAWYLTSQTTNQPSNRAIWVMGIYRDEFERIDGSWMISAIRFEFHYFTPFDEGWAKTPMWEIPS